MKKRENREAIREQSLIVTQLRQGGVGETGARRAGAGESFGGSQEFARDRYGVPGDGGDCHWHSETGGRGLGWRETIPALRRTSEPLSTHSGALPVRSAF